MWGGMQAGSLVPQEPGPSWWKRDKSGILPSGTSRDLDVSGVVEVFRKIVAMWLQVQVAGKVFSQQRCWI